MKFTFAAIVAALATVGNTYGGSPPPCPAGTERIGYRCVNPCPQNVAASAFIGRDYNGNLICQCAGNYEWDAKQEQCITPCPTYPVLAAYYGRDYKNDPICVCPYGFKYNPSGYGSCDRVYKKYSGGY